jgi:hypothetical protein
VTSPPEKPRDHWDEFKSWHSGPALYREIYARTAATLLAAAVIYLIAAISGLVSVQPLAVVGVPLLVVGLGCLVFSVVGTAKRWKLVRPLFVVWNNHTSPEMEHAKRLYTRLIIGIYSTLMGSIFIITAVAKSST